MKEIKKEDKTQTDNKIIEENNNKNKDENDCNIEILPENYPKCHLSFKIIVIGNSGKIFFIFLYLI